MRLLRRCEHRRTRGLYGDEIWDTMRRTLWPLRWGGGQLARVRCLDCGRALYDRPLRSATHSVVRREFETPKPIHNMPTMRDHRWPK